MSLILNFFLIFFWIIFICNIFKNLVLYLKLSVCEDFGLNFKDVLLSCNFFKVFFRLL